MNAAIDIERLIPIWQSLRTVIPITYITSDTEYDNAVSILNSLLDIVRDDIKHPLYSLVSIIGSLIENYEIDHEPLA